MLTEKKFVATIRKATGRRIGDNCGFIFGSMSPYVRSVDNSTAGEGYIVWKRNPTTGETQELRIMQRDADNQLPLIIEFLNTP